MGQMQRQKRLFREAMRKSGEKVPSRKVAAQRAMSIQIRRLAIVAQAAMEVFRATRKIRAVKKSDDGHHKVEVALITLEAMTTSIARLKEAAAVTVY